MSEYDCDFYYKHEDLEVMNRLDSLFDDNNKNRDDFLNTCQKLNELDGLHHAAVLFDSFEEMGVHQGRIGDYSLVCMCDLGIVEVESIMLFLHKLVGNLYLQAIGVGMSGELYLKMNNGVIEKKFANNSSEISVMKVWWESTLPKVIVNNFSAVDEFFESDEFRNSLSDELE